jgi:hypothetical protein
LLKPLLSLLPLGIVLLQVLAEVDQMNLNFQISLSNVLLLRLEVLFVSKIKNVVLLKLLFLDLESFMYLIHFSSLLEKLGSRGDRLELDVG